MAEFSFISGIESQTVGQYSSFTLSSLATREIQSFTRTDARGLFGFISSEESVSYCYKPSVIDKYIELDYGLITANHTTSINNGSITEKNRTLEDYGRIYYVTNVESFGFVKVVDGASWKATNSYEGLGIAFTFGRQTSPTVYGYITDGKVRCSGTADPAFSPVVNGRGGPSVHGNGAIGITAITTGSGNLFTLSSVTERNTYDYPATEGSLGLSGDAYLLRQHAYDTEGTLFALAGGDERKLFQYYGSGTINILARKPEEYRLSELANYTLGIHPGLDANLPLGQIEFYEGHTNIGTVQLRHLTKEFSHEKHTEVYTEESINYFEKVDYGLLDICTTTQTITGAVSGNATGCIVSVNGTASIVPGQSFRTARGINAATSFIDHGDVSKRAAPLHDYGHILTTSNIMPNGLFKFRTDTGAIDKFTPNWNGSGVIKVYNQDQILPIDVTEIGSGTIRALSGAAEATLISTKSDGLYKITGNSIVTASLLHLGSGSLKKLSGAAESITFNPEERQLLFSFTGTLAERYTQDHVGEGVLFTLQTAVERSVFDYVGSGTLFGLNNLEEAKVYAYNCSSIVEYRYIDYGLIVDRTNLAVTQIGTTTISTPTTAPSGAVQVINGATLTIAPGGSYTVPNQLSTPQYFEDFGTVTKRAAPRTDYGWILGTVQDGMPGCKYGNVEIEGVADVKFTPNWVGDGVIDISGVAYVPLDARELGSGNIKKLGGAAETVGFSEVSTDLFRVGGEAVIGITAVTVNEGNLFGIGGAAESATFNPPEETPLLKFTGSAEPPLLVYSEFSSGTLFSFAGGDERNAFAWEGSGGIKLLPRKPETYELSELAAFTLEDYQLCSPYINLGDTSFYSSHTQLGCTQLKWINLEESHEKHTEVYSLGLCFDQPELDYGLIVDRNAVACVTINGGIVTTNTTAATGCTKVAVGTVLQIAPGVTYEVPPQLSVPTDRQNYGDILKDLTGARIDYGHILEGTGINCPFGSLGRIGNNAEHRFLRNTSGTNALGGLIRIFGETDVFFTPPYIVEGEFRIQGAAKTTFSLLHPSEGGTIAPFSGAAETVRWSPDEEQLLFSFTGTRSNERTTTIAQTEGGSLFGIGGAAEAVVIVAPEPEGLFKVFGVVTESFRPDYIGSGSFRKLSGAAESVTFNPDEEQLLFTTKGAATTLFSLLHPGSGTIRVTPGVDQARALRPPAGGFIDISGGAVEAFIANPPEEQILFRITGVLGESVTPATHIGEGVLFNFGGSSELLTFAEQPEVNIKISGAAVAVRVPSYVGSGSFRKLSGAAESFTANPEERQLLFSFTGTLAESFTPAPEIGSGLAKLSGTTSPEILTFTEQPFGTISVLGDVRDRFTPQHIGSGSLFALNGAAEAVGFNPPEEAPLFKFTGELTEAFIANPPEEGTEIKLSGTTTPEILTFTEQPFGVISVFGDAETPRARDFIGSGSLRKLSGSAESITFNPEERDMLFSFTGGITSEKHTEVYVGVDTPIRIRRGSLSDFQTYDWQPSWVSEGTIPVRGDATAVYSPVYFGSGTFRKFSGAAESLTVNPDERQMLFSFTGESTERTSATHVGEGNLFAFSGGAERVAYAPSLLADLRINGEVGIRYVPNNVGFGNIFTIGGSAESVTFNPDERQLLFSFTGEVVESFGVAETKQIEVDLDGVGIFTRSFAHEGFGTITITGDSFDRFVVNNIGFGNIFTIGGSAESVTFNPEEKQMLFSFTGELAERTLVREISQGGTITITGTAGDPSLTFAEQPEIQIALFGDGYITASLRHIGSGSLFAFSGGAEAVGAVPPTEQALFRVSGNSVNKFAADYVGTGSLRKLSGAAESVSFNPDERQMLFSFTGERISEKRTSREISQGGTLKVSGESSVLLTLAHEGEGTIPVTGNTKFTRARDFVGFGTLRKLSGAAESLTFNPTERDMLFSFTGERIAERTTFRELGTTGKFTFSGTSGDPLLTFAEQPFVNIDVTGDSVDIRTRAYQGAGRLFTVNNVDEAFIRTGYQGSGNIKIDGIALVQVQLFQPPRTFVWII